MKEGWKPLFWSFSDTELFCIAHIVYLTNTAWLKYLSAFLEGTADDCWTSRGRFCYVSALQINKYIYIRKTEKTCIFWILNTLFKNLIKKIKPNVKSATTKQQQQQQQLKNNGEISENMSFPSLSDGTWKPFNRYVCICTTVSNYELHSPSITFYSVVV